NARASVATRYGWHCCLADKFGALGRGAVTDGRSLRAGGPGDQPAEGGADEHCLHCGELTGLLGHALLLRFAPGPMPGGMSEKLREEGWVATCRPSHRRRSTSDRGDEVCDSSDCLRCRGRAADGARAPVYRLAELLL